MSNDSKWEPEKAENNTNLEGEVLQPWKKYLEQSKEIKQSWTGAENLITFSACFLITSPAHFLLFISTQF